MRFLVDMPLSPVLAQWLSDKGHDAVHAAQRGLERPTTPPFGSDSSVRPTAGTTRFRTVDSPPLVTAVAGRDRLGSYWRGDPSFPDNPRRKKWRLRKLPSISVST
jgi:hypothetical protein